MEQAVQDRNEATVDVITPYLSHQNEVIRCAALRAYAACAPEPKARQALLDKLMDPDPDIRTDALERLVDLARPEDAELLRASLEGDPVREAKVAAIHALSSLQDKGSVSLLRSLVHSRSENRVAWEDEGGDWDDWLDVQVAAVTALGRMQVADAIEDFVTARNDEFGQNIDDAIFKALSDLGTPGIEVLFQIAKVEGSRAARRAAAEIAKTDISALVPFADKLLNSEDPDVRRIAISAMTPDDTRAVNLVRHDPSTEIRVAALRHVALARPDEVLTALQSPHEGVQAEALALLDGTVPANLHEPLVDNLLVWLRHAPTGLAIAAAHALPNFAPNRCEAPLLDVVADTDRHLEIRIAAVAALAGKSPPVATELFRAMLENPTRQVRTAALAELSHRAKCGEHTAVDTIVEAIRGELVSTGDDHASGNEAASQDAAMPKGEHGPQSIRITRDGDIVEGEEAPSGSTLHGILAATREPAPPTELAEDTPEEAPAKRRKRQPVEGPADFEASFQIDAIGICNDSCDARIEAELLACAVEGQELTRQAAWNALAKWPGAFQHSVAVRKAASAAMEINDPMVRSSAFSVLAKESIPVDALRLALESNDALLRAEAVGHLPARAAADFVTDLSTTVRQRSVACIVADGDPELAISATRRLLATDWTDTLAALISKSKTAGKEGLCQISQTVEPKQVLVLLEAFAGQENA